MTTCPCKELLWKETEHRTFSLLNAKLHICILPSSESPQAISCPLHDYPARGQGLALEFRPYIRGLKPRQLMNKNLTNLYNLSSKLGEKKKALKMLQQWDLQTLRCLAKASSSHFT